MGKSHRGKNMKGVAKKRGTCPITKRTGVKLIYTRKVGEEIVNVSKQGRDKSS